MSHVDFNKYPMSCHPLFSSCQYALCCMSILRNDHFTVLNLRVKTPRTGTFLSAHYLPIDHVSSKRTLRHGSITILKSDTNLYKIPTIFQVSCNLHTNNTPTKCAHLLAALSTRPQRGPHQLNPGSPNTSFYTRPLTKYRTGGTEGPSLGPLRGEGTQGHTTQIMSEMQDF